MGKVLTESINLLGNLFTRFYSIHVLLGHRLVVIMFQRYNRNRFTDLVCTPMDLTVLYCCLLVFTVLLILLCIPLSE